MLQLSACDRSGCKGRSDCCRDLGSVEGVRPIPILARDDCRRRLSSRGGERRLIPEREAAIAGLRWKRERVKARVAGQVVVSSSSRRAWKARLPILRATVSLATVLSRRSRVAR